MLGCSRTAPSVAAVPFTMPAIKDSILLRDSVIYKDSVLTDSLWYGEVTDSLGQVIGDLKVFFKKKIAELKLNEKRDTIYVEIPVLRSYKPTSLLPMVNAAFAWWEKVILYGGLGIIISGLIYLRVKRGMV